MKKIKPSERNGKEYIPEPPVAMCIELLVNGQRVLQRRYSASTIDKMCRSVGEGRYSPHGAAKQIIEQTARDLKLPGLTRTVELKMHARHANEHVKPHGKRTNRRARG